ncbi:hypothetical protein [Streptomyces sp. NPDC046332]
MSGWAWAAAAWPTAAVLATALLARIGYVLKAHRPTPSEHR